MSSHRIVVLDGHTLNPGDLSWEALEELGDVVVHDRTPVDAILERTAGAEIVLTNKCPLRRDTILAMRDACYIGVMATGHNVVDAEAACERAIPVTNVPIYGTRSVAQMTFAHILNLTQAVGHHAQTVRDGKWISNPDWCYWDSPLVELEGLTMGIVGLGRIGEATARLALAFGMKVLAYTPRPRASAIPGIEAATLDTLFRESDFISLHCPLTPDTQHLVNAQRLAMMKPTAFLINTSRGPLIDEAALAEALNAGRIAGAGLDVLSVEPMTPDNPLRTARNGHITPHNAWATRAARERLMDTVVSNVRAFLSGHPVNVVNRG